MIDKKIHQIWIQGESFLPEIERKYAKMWKDLSIKGGYTYKIWSEQDYYPLIIENDLEKEYHSLINMTQKSDIARWVILKKYGGLYADVDVEPIFKNGIPEWEKDILLMRVPIGIFSIFTFSISFIGIAASHHFSDVIVKEMKKRINPLTPISQQEKWWNIVTTTGVLLLRDVVNLNKWNIQYLDDPQITYNYDKSHYLSSSPSGTEYFIVHQLSNKDECNKMCVGARILSMLPSIETAMILLAIVCIFLILSLRMT